MKVAGTATQILPAGMDQPLSQMRKAIARSTSQSKAPVPHFYLTSRDRYGAGRAGPRSVQAEPPNPSFDHRLADQGLRRIALTRHPEINVSFNGHAIRRHAHIDIGIAVRGSKTA